MDRRTVMTGMLGTTAASLWTPQSAFALPKDKIKRIRYYKTPTDAAGRPNIHQPTFNQSTNIVTIETESGLIGVGEGGEPSTMEQCAGLLIGEDPFRIQHLWQVMERGYFYPSGREKTHSLGALDVALWDLKGKTLGGFLADSREMLQLFDEPFDRRGKIRHVGCVAQRRSLRKRVAACFLATAKESCFTRKARGRTPSACTLEAHPPW